MDQDTRTWQRTRTWTWADSDLDIDLNKDTVRDRDMEYTHVHVQVRVRPCSGSCPFTCPCVNFAMLSSRDKFWSVFSVLSTDSFQCMKHDLATFRLLMLIFLTFRLLMLIFLPERSTEYLINYFLCQRTTFSVITLSAAVSRQLSAVIKDQGWWIKHSALISSIQGTKSTEAFFRK